MFIENLVYFIHIPKNGGSYVREIINLNGRKKKVSNLNIFKKFLIERNYFFWPVSKKDLNEYIIYLESKWHVKIKNIHNLLYKATKAYVEYFAVIRDPIERFKSLYIQVIKRQHRARFTHFYKWCRRKKLEINISNFSVYLDKFSRYAVKQADFIEMPRFNCKYIKKITLIKNEDLTAFMKNRFKIISKDKEEIHARYLENSGNNNFQDDSINTRYSNLQISKYNKEVNWDINISKQTLNNLKKIYKRDFEIWDNLNK